MGSFRPIKLEQLQRVCRSYGDGAGLGWGSFHPKQILHLPEEYQVRVLDMNQEFEDRPRVISEPLANIIVLDKQGGGVRPIGLLRTFTKIWSKRRQRECRRWEQAHQRVFLFCQYSSSSWGVGPAFTREKAGWVHNMLAHVGKVLGTSAAAVLLDKVP